MKQLAGMGVEQLNLQERNLLRSTPRQDLLLGYWQELLEKPFHELREQRTRELTALRDTGTAYHYVSRVPVNPGYESWFRNVFPEIGITVLSGSGHFPHIAQPEDLVKILSGWKKLFRGSPGAARIAERYSSSRDPNGGRSGRRGRCGSRLRARVRPG